VSLAGLTVRDEHDVSVQGDVTLRAPLNRPQLVSAQLALAAPGWHAVKKSLGIPLALPAGNEPVSATLSLQNPALNATLAIGGTAVEFSGQPRPAAAGSGGFDGRIAGDVAPALLGPFAFAFGPREGPLSVEADVAADPNQITFSSLAMARGITRLTGRVNVALDGPKPAVSGSATLSGVPVAKAVSGQSARRPDPQEDAGGFETPEFSSRRLDLDWLNALDAEIDLQVSAGPPALAPLTDGSVAVRLEDATLTLDDVEATLGGGRLNGRLTLAGGDEPSISSALEVDGMTVGNDGTLNARFDGAASGASIRAWIQTLSGAGEYSVEAAPQPREAGIAQALMAPFYGLSAIGDFLGRTPGRSGLETTFLVRSGLVAFEGLTFRAPSYRGTFAGQFDLARWDIDAAGTVTLTGSRESRLMGQRVELPETLPLSVDGNPSEPRVRADISGGIRSVAD